MDLNSLYQNTASKNLLHSQFYVEGVILGAACCPEIPMPNIWMPWLFKQQRRQLGEPELTDCLFAFFKDCLNEMRQGTLSLPKYISYKDVTAADFKPQDNEPLKDWCRGILTAHGATESSWQTAWSRMQESHPTKAPVFAKELKHCLKMFSTFSDPLKTIEQSPTPDELKKHLPVIANSLRASLISYVRLSGELASYLPNQFETFAQQQ